MERFIKKTRLLIIHWLIFFFNFLEHSNRDLIKVYLLKRLLKRVTGVMIQKIDNDMQRFFFTEAHLKTSREKEVDIVIVSENRLEIRRRSLQSDHLDIGPDDTETRHVISDEPHWQTIGVILFSRIKSVGQKNNAGFNDLVIKISEL